MTALALEATHEQLLIAAIGGIVSIILVALPITVALINKQGRETKRVIVAGQELAATAAETVAADIRPHLPPNGKRLYEMVEATAATVQDLQLSVAKLSSHVLQLHEMDAETRAMLIDHLDRTAPLVAFVEQLMGKSSE